LTVAHSWAALATDWAVRCLHRILQQEYNKPIRLCFPARLGKRAIWPGPLASGISLVNANLNARIHGHSKLQPTNQSRVSQVEKGEAEFTGLHIYGM